MKKRKKPTDSMYEGESEPEDLFCNSDDGSSDDSGCQPVPEPVTKKKKLARKGQQQDLIVVRWVQHQQIGCLLMMKANSGN